MRKTGFASQVGLVFGATALGTGLLNFFLLFVGRWIGPEAFGTYFLAYSISTFIVLPTAYGIGPATTFTLARTGRLAPGAMATVIFATAAILLVGGLWVTRSPLAVLLALPESVVAAGILFSVPLAGYLFAEHVLTGVRRYPGLAVLRVLVPVGFVVIVVTQVFGFGKGDFAVPLWGRAVPYLAASGIILAFVIRAFSRTEWPALGPFLRYAGGAALSSASSVVFISLDKLILARSLNADELGIYSALFLASFMVAGRLSEAFTTVLFPESARQHANAGERLAPRLPGRIQVLVGIAVLCVVLSALQFLAIWILGERYHASWTVVAWFALGASLYGASEIRWWYLASFGNRGIRLFGFSSVIASVILVAGLIILAPAFRLAGAAAAFVLASGFNLIMGLACEHRIRHNP